MNFERCWLSFFRPIECCLLLYGDFAMTRFREKCKSLFVDEMEEDMPWKFFAVLTSSVRMLCLNVARCEIQDTNLLVEEIENSGYCERVVLVRPRFTRDPAEHIGRLAHLCTSLGYYKRPFCISSILTPICEACWRSEIPIPPYRIPCGNPSHVVCSLKCLNSCTYCPYQTCVLSTIKLDLLLPAGEEEIQLENSK